jgi:hypothetical protein
MTGSTGSKLALLPKTPLLMSESEDEFEALRSDLVDEIKPIPAWQKVQDPSKKGHEVR